MPSAKRRGPAERMLLAVGTASYDCQDFPALGKVPDALRSMVEVLKDLGFATVIRPPGYRLDPALASLRAVVRRAAAAAPVVVVYYTGHGADLEQGTYYLVGKKSRPAKLADSALAARDLLDLLTVRDDRGDPLADQPAVLVILDCCYSGSAGMTMLREALHGIGNPNTWVIATAGTLEYAQQGLFAQAFRDALRRPTTGPSQRYLDPIAIVQAVNEICADQAHQQARVLGPAAGSTHIPPFFPNPIHQQGLAGLTVANQQHWLSRLRGGPQESTTGFYLVGETGRLLAAERLAGWMTDPGPTRLAVVTGSPGTGKSALLALPALLTSSWRKDLLNTVEPDSLVQRMARLLPDDTLATAVHARGLNTDQAGMVIAQTLGREVDTSWALLEHLDERPEHGRRTVIVDAVDEAKSPGTLVDFLHRLARQPGLQVVVGARRPVASEIKDADLTIDLDTSDYQDPQALTHYIYRLLIASEEPGIATPYKPDTATASGDRDKTVAVAEAIAQRATTRGGSESFLLGRLLALSVRGRAEAADISSQGWQSELPAGVAEIFDEDLARLGTKASLAKNLLTALAWAKGPGLPWENIWVPVARALPERDDELDHGAITDEDVRWLLDKAGAYVVEDQGPGQRSVYRPFHELLAAYLRDDPLTTAQIDADPEIDPDPEAVNSRKKHRARTEEAITHALLETVPIDESGRRDWTSAHPYLQTYIVHHAHAAGPETYSLITQDGNFRAAADWITSVDALQVAVESFDRPGVDRLCTQIIAALRGSDLPPDERDARRIFNLLRRKRHFQHLQRVAEAFMNNGLDRPFIRRIYAQALLNQEVLTAGLSILDGLIRTTDDDSEQLAEARGLVGQANKQLYVLSAPSADERCHMYLRKAIRAYFDVYQDEPQARLSHGINTAALLKRAASDGVDVPGFPDPSEDARLIARQVLDVIMAKPKHDTWDRATAMEACVALDQAEDALRWLDSYVDGPYTDAFELGSTLKQLIEVWRLRGDQEPGAGLLPLLRAKLLEREGGEITVRPSDLGRWALDEMTEHQPLERVFGAERFQSLGWFKDALERCRAVARIEDEYGDGIGTGFLVEGTALHASFPGVVLVTNAHIIPDAIAHEDAFITFRALDDAPNVGRRHRIQNVLWTSPRDELDATVVSLQSVPPGVTPCPTAPGLPRLDTSPPPRAFIVGHPSGRVLPMFSIQDNLLLDYDGTRVHYRAPTQPGSSGSPVFDRRWKLIAMHHAASDEMPMLHGGGTYQANEGIWIGRIKQAIQHDLSR